MNPIQALNIALQQNTEWYAKIELNNLTTEIEFLFFIHKSSREILVNHGELLIIDCIYMTNRYRMPLAIMTGVTGLDTSFYAGMCFMKGQREEDYKRLIRFIKELYKDLDIPLPLIWISDGDPGIPAAIASEISPQTVHLLGVWYIKQNVLRKCRKHFRRCENAKELWIQFNGNKNATPKVVGDFQALIYANTPEAFNVAWHKLQEKYTPINYEMIRYLAKEIIPKKEKWSRAWTDSCLHFDNHTSLRSEQGHASLKASLDNSSDFDTIVHSCGTVCDRQRDIYLMELGKAKARLPTLLTKPIFREVRFLVTPYALPKVLKQYELLIEARDKGTGLPPCTGKFVGTLGLPCAHKIEENMADAGNGGVLKLEDIHHHWRFNKPKRRYIEPDDFVDVDGDDELAVRDAQSGISRSKRARKE